MGDTTVVVPAEDDAGGTDSADFAAGVAAATSVQAAQDAQEASVRAEGAQDTAEVAVRAAGEAEAAAYDAKADVAALRTEVTAGFESVTGALAGIAARFEQQQPPAAEHAPAPPTREERQPAASDDTPKKKSKPNRMRFGAWGN